MFFIILVQSSKLDQVYVHFMIAGHTKFSCDAMFGTIASILRRNCLKNLSDIVSLINRKMKSSRAYQAKLLKQSICFNFKEHYGMKCPTIKRIKKYHHFSFKKIGGGQVKIEVKEKLTDDEWSTISMNQKKI